MGASISFCDPHATHFRVMTAAAAGEGDAQPGANIQITVVDSHMTAEHEDAAAEVRVG